MDTTGGQFDIEVLGVVWRGSWLGRTGLAKLFAASRVSGGLHFRFRVMSMNLKII